MDPSMNRMSDFLIKSDEKIPQVALRFEGLIAMELPPVLIVVDENNLLLGSITDGDIRRFIIQNNKIDEYVFNVMNRKCYRVEKKAELTIPMLDAYKVIPVVDNKSKVIDILFANSQKEQSILSMVSVVINAGGLGSRLYPYTKAYPKPLVPVNRIPMIDHVISSFLKYGIKNFKFVLNYKKDMIIEYLSSNYSNLNLEFIIEDEPYGTVGGLAQVEGLSEHFIFSNCDILVEHDLSLMFDLHLKNKHKLTIVSSMLTNTIPYGVLTTDKLGVLDSIHEKPTTNHFVSTGLYIIDRAVLRYIPKNKKMDMDFYIKLLINNNIKVGIYPIEFQQWSDMGNIEGLLKTEIKLSGEKRESKHN